MTRRIFMLFLLTIAIVLTACSGNADKDNSNKKDTTDKEETATQQDKDAQKVQVDLNNGEDESVGTATLTQDSDGVEITLEGENLPKGTHAFHIHEKGQCEAPAFESAGGHFNPDDTKHGFDASDGPHAGDMPNIEVGEDGTVKQSFLVKNVTLKKGEKNSLLRNDGTSLVIHEGADDGKSQPAGDAGDRLACGPIK
ncbi:superoxide dismutase family protein [Lentibacillus sp. N15]|uniref:superoxide dismutase family protein n=1 Tax=Lentibacillus songyuanensis TaxID=3136161 RepID=UPI0031B9F2E8